MKKLLLSGFLALLFLSPSISLAGEKPLIITLRIDKTTTQEDLDKQVEFLAANGYSLVIDHVEYNADGGVKSISGKVDFNKTSGEFYNDDLGDNGIVIKKSLLGNITIHMSGKP